MAKLATRKPPSRIRYEQAHPTVSCRVPKELYDRLQAVKEAAVRSFADILRAGLGLLEAHAKDVAKIKEQGYIEGYKRGYAEAERNYKIVYPCFVCRKATAATSAQEKEAIKEYMQEHGWGHAECHEKGGKARHTNCRSRHHG